MCRQTLVRIHFPLRAMTADPVPRMGAKELFPMRTQRPVTGRYEMKALLLGIMWSVAPVSATRRLVQGQSLVDTNAMECAGGLLRSGMTHLGS
jgi:hypothetical protein